MGAGVATPAPELPATDPGVAPVPTATVAPASAAVPEAPAPTPTAPDQPSSVADAPAQPSPASATPAVSTTAPMMGPDSPGRSSADPFASVPAYDSDRAPGLGPDVRGYVTVKAPRWRGTGQFALAGITFAAGVTFQMVDMLMCLNCATGITERVFFASSIGLAAGAGATRAHADAYDDVAMGRSMRNPRRALIAGAVLTGVGATLGLVNEGMWWRCVVDREGPYRQAIAGNDFFTHPCNYEASRGMLDLAVGATATGMAMLTWAITYRRDARAYRRARVIDVSPLASRGQLGLQIGGRF